MGSSRKKVFAHYFGPYPRSINNSATLAADTYTTIYNNPHYAAFAAAGGFFRDRPIFRSKLPGDSKYSDCVWDIGRAKAAGIDGFFCDLLGLSGSNYANYESLKRAAHDLNNGFKVIPMIDANGATGAASPKSAAAYVKTFAGLNCSYHLPDGRFLVSCFKAEGKPLQWWSDMLKSLKADWGITAAFIGVYNNIHSAKDYTSISYGSSPWGYGADPGTISHAADYASSARARGEIFMAPVVAQDQRPQAGLYDEAANTGALRAAWTKAIAENAEMVQIVSWSDYSETGIAPTAANGWVNLDLSSWFITRWKTGAYPKILRDAVFLSHRSHTTGAHITGTQTKFMKQWSRANRSPAQNNVEALTFLTASATVSVRVGTKVYSYDAPAGMFSRVYPAQAGKVSVSVARKGSVTATLTSPESVKSSETVWAS